MAKEGIKNSTHESVQPFSSKKPSSRPSKAPSMANVSIHTSTTQTTSTNSISLDNILGDDHDQPTAVIAPADYENYFTNNRKQKNSKVDKLKKVPSDSLPTALLAPVDYVNFFENQNRREKKAPAASLAKTYDEDDMPTALLPPKEHVKPKILRSIMKPTAKTKQLAKKSLKITSDMPTVMLAQDYENFFSKQKKGLKTVPKKKATPTQDVLSECPTALLAPEDYQQLFTNYRQKNTRTPPRSEVPASIIEMMKPRKKVVSSVVNEPKIVRSIRPRAKTVSPSTSPSQGITSPTSTRRRSRQPTLLDKNENLSPEQYYSEDYAEPEMVEPIKMKKKKWKKRKKKCCCCC